MTVKRLPVFHYSLVYILSICNHKTYIAIFENLYVGHTKLARNVQVPLAFSPFTYFLLEYVVGPASQGSLLESRYQCKSCN